MMRRNTVAGSPQRLRGLFHLAVELEQHGLHGAHHEGSVTNRSAITTATRVNAMSMPTGLSGP